MTEMQVHPDLSTQEEYARSGHTAPDQNTNTEGYVEATPAMNVPGGMAMCGYKDCHWRVYPYPLDRIGLTVAGAGGGMH